MKVKNRFFIAKEFAGDIIPDYNYNLSTGESYSDLWSSTSIIQKSDINLAKLIRLSIDNKLDYTQLTVLYWDNEDNYIGYKDTENTEGIYIDIFIPQNIKYIAFLISGTVPSTIQYTYKVEYCIPIFPHYKQLKKKYKKENSQAFFRESLDGKLSLFGLDYELVNNSSIEDILKFYIYRKNILLVSASFNKSDCKFDHFKKSVELGLKYDDKYSSILDAYENTYDLIKLAPALTPIILTKRCIAQIYVQGEKVLSNYAGGSYWETDVDEPIDDVDALERKYFFSRGPKYMEVSLEGFNYNINAAYRGVKDSDTWASVSTKTAYDGSLIKAKCYIKFVKVMSAGDIVNTDTAQNVLVLSDGTSPGHEAISGSTQGSRRIKYDTYRIEIYENSQLIYQSDKYYGKDDNGFILAQGSSLYPMSAVDLPVPYAHPTPDPFYLGENVIEYQIWGRLLCDVDSTKDGTVVTHDLPRDDFATPRHNYRKCIGLAGFNTSSSLIQIVHNSASSESPMSYGINDYGEYFIPPTNYLYNQYYYPVARNTWANTSMWAQFGIANNITAFELFCQQYYKEYTVKDVYHIGDAIKAILAQIDSSIKHEKTPEYSSFLYGHSGGTAGALGGCDIYITQKTNILKGEYDQAAQKAEIKFSQLMEMLRDCFRCYWFIDSENRFRIEHISYFMKGFSYDNPFIQLDLTSKKDKFNKKPVLYCQQEVEYDKADLISRYEFSWADNSTKVMGGDLYIDINNAYIKGHQTEEINIDGFSADVDYMLFLPDDFSNDGFALLMADSNKKVPIVRTRIKDEKQYQRQIDAYVQNWYASFNNLIWHYMEDISGNVVSYNNVDSLLPGHVKRCMKHNIEIQTERNIDMYKLITTDIGNGYIEEITTDIDTNSIEIELRYEPS